MFRKNTHKHVWLMAAIFAASLYLFNASTPLFGCQETGG